MLRRNSEINRFLMYPKILIVVASLLFSISAAAGPRHEPELDFYELAQSFATCSSGLNILATLMNEQVRPALEGSARGA